MSEERAKIHIDITSQDTTAKLRCECIGVSDYHKAILYDIPDLKYFPMFSKVKFLGKEEWFYCVPENRMLISKDAKPLDFWLGKQNKESEDKSMLHNVTVTKAEEKVLEEYYVMRGIKKQHDGLGSEKKVVCREREVSQYPDLGTIAQFLNECGADFVSVKHNYRFEPDLPFC